MTAFATPLGRCVVTITHGSRLSISFEAGNHVESGAQVWIDQKAAMRRITLRQSTCARARKARVRCRVSETSIRLRRNLLHGGQQDRLRPSTNGWRTGTAPGATQSQCAVLVTGRLQACISSPDMSGEPSRECDMREVEGRRN